MKDRAKVVFVSLIIFFGTAFAIMSFNEDVAVQGLFEKIYMMITGTKQRTHCATVFGKNACNG